MSGLEWVIAKKTAVSTDYRTVAHRMAFRATHSTNLAMLMNVSEFKIRQATADDAAVLGQHRCAMFKDMGLMSEGPNEEFQSASASYFREVLAGDSWFGWIVAVGDTVIGGAVLHMTLMPPRNNPNGGLIEARLQGLIMNVYVEPEWRRKGIAADLMDTILAFAHDRGAASVTLHASQKGKPLYEKMGFLPTHEMRLFL